MNLTFSFICQMPLLYYLNRDSLPMRARTTRNLHTGYGSITIGLQQALSLISAVILLKVLHVALSVHRTFGRYQTPNSLKSAIDRTEQRILKLFLAIIPESAYQGSTQTNNPAAEENGTAISDGTRGAHAHDVSLRSNTLKRQPRSISLQATHAGQGKVVCEPPTYLQDSGLHASLVVPTSMSASPRASGSSDRVRMEDTAAGGRSGIASVPRASISGSIYSNTAARDIRLLSASRGRSASSGVPEQGVHSSMQYGRLVSHRSAYSSPSRQSSLNSTFSRMVSLERSVSPTGGSVCELDALQSYRSAASYPGKYPVSDGLEYSNLATAPQGFEGLDKKGTRPFSEM